MLLVNWRQSKCELNKPCRGECVAWWLQRCQQHVTSTDGSEGLSQRVMWGGLVETPQDDWTGTLRTGWCYRHRLTTRARSHHRQLNRQVTYAKRIYCCQQPAAVVFHTQQSKQSPRKTFVSQYCRLITVVGSANRRKKPATIRRFRIFLRELPPV